MMQELKSRLLAAFTLIELLVVVGIIALLAAILLPALGRAREVAKSSSCMSNLHNIGTALQIYQTTFGGYFPIDYQYNNGEGNAAATGSGATAGYYHWTAALEPEEYTTSVFAAKFPRVENQFVCPSHVPHGFAPTNYTINRLPAPPFGQAPENSNFDDKQTPRLSYVANEAIMPRKKYGVSHDQADLAAYQAAGGAAAAGTFAWNNTSNLCQVNVDEIAAPANTILLAEFSDNSNCIFGSSTGGGSAYKSHRPTNGVKVSKDGGATYNYFDAEKYNLDQGNKFYKLTATDAQNAIDAVLADKSVAASNHHISYINPNQHKTGSNYLFVDGHAAQFSLSQTLDPNNYMWGRKMYSCADKPEILDSTTP